MEKQYKIINGTYYPCNTRDEIIEVLEQARHRGDRIKLYYGDAETGKDWKECYDVCGTIGRTTGGIKCPILLSNVRSTGGGLILTDCIVRIEYANKATQGKRVLYSHEKYHN
jgi:hypothetical protein